MSSSNHSIYYTAILVCGDKTAKKYHNINRYKLKIFEIWAVSKFPNVCHVNYYDHSGKFVVQNRLSN